MDWKPVLNTIVMSFDLATGAWPITALVVAAAIWGALSLTKRRKLLSWQALTVFGSLLFPAIVVPPYTVRFWADPRIHTSETQELLLNLLVAGWVVFALIHVASIVAARGFRLPLAGVSSLVMWFAAGMYLLSMMAISGIWL